MVASGPSSGSKGDRPDRGGGGLFGRTRGGGVVTERGAGLAVPPPSWQEQGGFVRRGGDCREQGGDVLWGGLQGTTRGGIAWEGRGLQRTKGGGSLGGPVHAWPDSSGTARYHMPPGPGCYRGGWARRWALASTIVAFSQHGSIARRRNVGCP